MNMKHVKLFENWLNESLPADKYFTICLNTVIYMCLRSFSPVDGNTIDNKKIVDLAVSISPDLFTSDSPDFWVNCGDFDGKIDDELDKVSEYYKDHHKEIDDAFKQWGIEIESLDKDEVIVSLFLPYHVRTSEPEYLKANAEFVMRFYEELQPQGLKSLEKELGSHLTGKEYGI
jgi:hypothetical protein